MKHIIKTILQMVHLNSHWAWHPVYVDNNSPVENISPVKFFQTVQRIPRNTSLSYIVAENGPCHI